mmetsp:Transcript_60157/g.107140  ORF Transcript_60157/g.107140 Transcript_60157/m.107140 type:complete len:459 (-) Transcript_60157:152-1528(-)
MDLTSPMAGRTPTAASNLARKFEFLQERAQRRPIGDASLSIGSGETASTKADISQLKEFYLQRLAKNEPHVAARLTAQMQRSSAGDPAQPQASGQREAPPAFPKGSLSLTLPSATAMGQRPAVSSVTQEFCKPISAAKDNDELEIMCNVCFTLIKASQVDAHTRYCYMDRQSDGAAKPADQTQVLDMKLQKLRTALEARLQEASSKVNVMRHLTQLRYHIDTAAKWVPGCSEIGALSDHTVQQVKQLTATSRVLAPAIYIFSKRIESVVIQKERELRKAMVQNSAVSKTSGTYEGGVFLDVDRDATAESVADVNSIVSEMDSDTGTQYAETQVTQDNNGPAGTADVGNLADANEYLSLKNEDEQRRWFYSQCLTAKLACPDKAKARKVLISDLYTKVREDKVPIDGWVQWIRQQLALDDTDQAPGPASGRANAMHVTIPVASPMPKANAGASMFSGFR